MTANPSPTTVAERLYIRLADSSDQELLITLKRTLDSHKGDTEVVLVLGPGSQKQIIKLPNGVNKNDAVMATITDLVGASNIKLQ